MNTHYIALVRSRPCSARTPTLLATLAEVGAGDAPATVFFQGDGCEMAHALAGGAFGPFDAGRCDLCVCATSWQRRFGHGTASSPLRVESLVFFFQRLARARRVDSFGPGGWFCWRAPDAPATHRSGARLLLEVASAPADERQRRETLEMALGAAALELEGSVFLHGSGLEHLAGDGARGWRQLADFDLLEIVAGAPGDAAAPGVGIGPAGCGTAMRLRAAASTILLL